MNNYLDSAKKNGFDLVKQYDQTDNTMPTLEYADYFLERFIYNKDECNRKEKKNRWKNTIS